MEIFEFLIGYGKKIKDYFFKIPCSAQIVRKCTTEIKVPYNFLLVLRSQHFRNEKLSENCNRPDARDSAKKLLCVRINCQMNFAEFEPKCLFPDKV